MARDRQLYVAIFGKEIGDGEDDPGGPEGADPWKQREETRARQWQALPKELKLAIKRVHVNLGHAPTPAMLRALRIARASDVAVKACRPFRCPDCPRLQEPKIPRPSKLPIADEFNVLIGVDVFKEKDAQGQSWTFLNILDQGTLYQVVCVLADTFANPTGAVVLEAMTTSWFSWAGFPERGIVSHRAKYFLAEVAEDLASQGCFMEAAARATPWQLGAIERHGATWKAALRRLVWAQQVIGRGEAILAAAATNAAKNSLARKSGFSPSQWVLGKQIRLPADLADENELGRIGALAMAETAGTRFHRRNQLRFAAREAYVQASNDSALRRAELRQVRPTRGPFPVGCFVFYDCVADKSYHWESLK